ncbi:MAG: phenylalanine--tRNA ligase subunit beta [Acidobacteria bacterium]|nr:phenylalanine--tRNA ligase subunit beta [Acidobacteriota bacterium]
MKISRDWLSDFIDLSGIDDGALAARLTEIGHAVEATESHGDDCVFEIEFTTNRVDAMSHLGIARELCAALGRDLLPRPSVAAATIGDTIPIRIDTPAMCSRYTGLVVRGVKVAPSSAKIQRRLEAVGLRPINNVVDVTNYVMMALGHPLHAFDLAFLQGPEIVVRAAKQGETMTTLDGVERKLDSEMVVIADAKRGVALGGVMGGENSEISERTTDVLLECAHFNASTIRRSSRELALYTDASYRFERGADPGDTIAAIELAADLIVSEAGGRKASPIDAVARVVEPKEVSLRRVTLQTSSAGLIDLDVAAGVLSRLGMGVAESPDALVVTVPTWRGDISEEIDLIEEALRFHGFNRIPSELPRVTTGDVTRNVWVDVEDRMRDILSGCGLSEVVTYSFIPPAQNALFRSEATLDVTNALTENISSMRLSLLPGLLQSVAYNWSYGIRDGAMFEVGRTYHVAGKLAEEKHRAAFVMFGARSDHWSERGRQADFFDGKGVVEVVASAFHVELEWERVERSYFSADTAAKAMIGGREAAVAGVVSRDLLKAFDIGSGVTLVAGEIELSAIAESAAPWTMTDVSRYPGVPMVVAFMHKPDLEYGTIVRAIRAMEIPQLRDVGVWDRFVPEKGEGEVKTALGLWYQTLDRSLTQEEVGEVHARLVEKILAALPVRVIT